MCREGFLGVLRALRELLESKQHRGGISQSTGEHVRAEQGPWWWLCREPWTSELLLKEVGWDTQGWAQPSGEGLAQAELRGWPPAPGGCPDAAVNVPLPRRAAGWREGDLEHCDTRPLGPLRNAEPSRWV